MATILLLRIYAGLRCAQLARRKDVPPMATRLAWALTAIQAASLFSFLGRFQAHWQNKDDFQAKAVSHVFLAGQFVSLAVAVLGIGIVLWVVTHVLGSVSRTERLANVMITTPFVDVKTSELGLTAREMEVLEVMAEGRFSDQEIAEAFYITPATAATHVRNILRKADLHNRRDLVLFYGAGKLETD
jgi:DNA-binding CsgD family transcriptional regulator